MGPVNSISFTSLFTVNGGVDKVGNLYLGKVFRASFFVTFSLPFKGFVQFTLVVHAVQPSFHGALSLSLSLTLAT